VRAGRQKSTYYFSCSGGTGSASTKSALGHVTTNLFFLHPVGSVGHVVHFGAYQVRNIDALFFILGWDRYGFHKNNVETRYAECVFLYLVGPTGHVVCFGASGVRNVDALFLMLRWYQYEFQKNHVGPRYAEGVFLHLRGYVDPVVHFGASRVRNVDALFFMLG
jgi:hypothetical protein